MTALLAAVGAGACDRNSPFQPGAQPTGEVVDPRGDAGVTGAAGRGAAGSSATGDGGSAGGGVAVGGGATGQPESTEQQAAPAGPTGASPAERERVLELMLSGQLRTKDLPEEATGAERTFDPRMRERLTTITVETGPEAEKRKLQPQVKMVGTRVKGRLPREVIDRIVRQQFGRFRLCYESGLRKKPDLQGNVTVKFVISPSGDVASVSDGGSDLADAGVVTCVMKAFHGLTFPMPEGGLVVVTFPILFAPHG